MGPFLSKAFPRYCWRKNGKHAGLTKPGPMPSPLLAMGHRRPRPMDYSPRVLHRAYAQLAHAGPTLAGATSLGRLGSM